MTCVIIMIIKKTSRESVDFQNNSTQGKSRIINSTIFSITQLLTNDTVLERSISGPATGRINTRTRILKS